MDVLNKRVVLVMEKKSVNKTAFAADLDISQAVVTHITTGRNKPGVELLQKILMRYPTISAEWLLLGTGNMEKAAGTDTAKLKQALQLAEMRLQNSAYDINAVREMLKEQAQELP